MIKKILNYIINTANSIKTFAQLTNPPMKGLFNTSPKLAMPIPGVKCPNCLGKGETVWVIPGKNCPECGTPCGRMIAIVTAITLSCVVIIGINGFEGLDIFKNSFEYCDASKSLGSYFKESTNFQTESLDHATHSRSHMPIPGVKCPNCLSKGETVWVIPGKNCPECGTPCGRMIAIIAAITLTFSFQALNMFRHSFEYCDSPKSWELHFEHNADLHADSLGIYDNVILSVALTLLLSALIHATHSRSHMPIPGVKCPNCLSKGETVWVIPGKNCPECGTPCGRVIAIVTAITLTSGIVIAINTLEGLDIFRYSFEYCDAPRPWGLYFQDSGSPQMEGLVELHNNIMYYLIIILFAVGWILAAALKFKKAGLSHKYLSHGTLVELIWTITPGLILIFVAFTSFKLLYLVDEVSDINMSFYIEGHQWYWSYEYPDFLGNDGDIIEYDSYLIPESDLELGTLRMLDVDERVMLPEITHGRFIVSSGDVIHSYACPALAIKSDAYPGRLNQASALINRIGTFYGQCSEICGILHSGMPISIQSLSLEKFLLFLFSK